MESRILLGLLLILVAITVHGHLIIGRDLRQRKIFRSHDDSETAIHNQSPHLQKRSLDREQLKMKLAKLFPRSFQRPQNEDNGGM